MKEYQDKYVKMLLDYTRLMPENSGEVRTAAVGLPSLEKFASRINVTRRTLDTWAAEHEEFDLAMKEATARICDTLCDMGAAKCADPSFIKFLLVTKYGYDEDASENAEDKPFELVLTVVR